MAQDEEEEIRQPSTTRSMRRKGRKPKGRGKKWEREEGGKSESGWVISGDRDW